MIAPECRASMRALGDTIGMLNAFAYVNFMLVVRLVFVWRSSLDDNELLVDITSSRLVYIVLLDFSF